MKIRGILAVLVLGTMTMLAQEAPKPDDHAACKRDKDHKMSCCKKDKDNKQKECCKKGKCDKEHKDASSDKKS